MIFANLLPSNFKIIASVMIFALIAGVFSFFILKYNNAIAYAEQSKIDLINVEKQKTALAQTNDQNQQTIKILKEENVKKEKVVSDFRIQKARDDKKIADFQAVIISYSSDKDGSVSQVLKDTVTNIAHDREERLK